MSDKTIEIELGRTYMDIVTGFVGIAVSRTTYISGCDSVALSPKINKDGETGEINAFDITRLKQKVNKKIEVPVLNTPGGNPTLPTTRNR